MLLLLIMGMTTCVIYVYDMTIIMEVNIYSGTLEWQELWHASGQLDHSSYCICRRRRQLSKILLSCINLYYSNKQGAKMTDHLLWMGKGPKTISSPLLIFSLYKEQIHPNPIKFAITRTITTNWKMSATELIYWILGIVSLWHPFEVAF